MQEPLTIWCVSDGKPGHHSQLSGLVRALAERQHCRVHWLDTGASPRQQAAAIGGAPALILCAGHRTHRHSLLLKWRYGGILVALMNPSLPRWLFDLCVIPRHDAVPASKRVLLTRGTLNDIRPSYRQREQRGLILVGGPSRHHRWRDADMLQQIQQLMASQPRQQWTLGTSRRTPASFLPALADLQTTGLDVVPAEHGDRDWLRGQYASCNTVWVSEDSASMVYEALTSGARVGVLAVPRRRTSRVSRGLDQLLAEGSATSLDSTARVHTPSAARPDAYPGEADRVSRYLLEALIVSSPVATNESSAGLAPPR